MKIDRLKRMSGWIKSMAVHSFRQLAVETRIKKQKKYSCDAVYQATVAAESAFQNSSPVFFLSTGRAGSAYVTHLFSGMKNVWVEHEASPVLMSGFHELFYDLDTNPRAQKHVFKAARYEKMLRYFLAGYRYIESNHVLTALADGIADIFTSAQFVVVTRNPISFAHSALAKGWFQNDTIWENSRVGYSYECSSRIGKIINYWTEINLRLERVIDDYQDRAIWVRFEDIVKDPTSVMELASFLRLDIPGGDKRIVDIMGRPINKNRVNYWDHDGMRKTKEAYTSKIVEFLDKLPIDSPTHRLMCRFGYNAKA